MIEHRSRSWPGSRRGVDDRVLDRRRGSTYVIVLFVAMTVVVLGLSGVAIERVRTRATSRENDWTEAQVLAHSAVEQALFVVCAASKGDSNWRDLLKAANGDKSGAMPLGGGTIEWELLNHHGDRMSGDPEKSIYVVGTGTKGEASHSLRVIVRPSGPAYSAIASGVHALDDLEFASGVLIQSDAPVSANGDATATSADILADVQVAGQVFGGTYHGVIVPSAPIRGVPGSDLIEYYEANGTLIDGFELPTTVSEHVLENVVLSSGVNPYGAGVTNPEGIYVLDVNGRDLLIRNARIMGTLLVTGLGDGHSVIVEGSVHMAPAVSNLPALLADGKLQLDMSAVPIDELSIGANLNPIGSPYMGESDALLDDVYPSLIQGLVYSKRTLRLSGVYNTVDGMLLSRSDVIADVNARLDLTYMPSIAEDPPPGFFVPDGSVQIGLFSWVQFEDHGK